LGTFFENKVFKNQSFQKISLLKVGLLKKEFESQNFAIFEDFVNDFGRFDDDIIS
jgi:hypothetical protein